MEFEMWHRMRDHEMGHTISFWSLFVMSATPISASRVKQASVTRTWYDPDGRMTKHEHEVLTYDDLIDYYGNNTADHIRQRMMEDGYQSTWS